MKKEIAIDLICKHIANETIVDVSGDLLNCFNTQDISYLQNIMGESNNLCDFLDEFKSILQKDGNEISIQFFLLKFNLIDPIIETEEQEESIETISDGQGWNLSSRNHFAESFISDLGLTNLYTQYLSHIAIDENNFSM